MGIHEATLPLARFTSTHAVCVISRHTTVNDLGHAIKRSHLPVCFFAPQAASAFRGHRVRIAVSPTTSPGSGIGFDPSFEYSRGSWRWAAFSWRTRLILHPLQAEAA